MKKGKGLEIIYIYKYINDPFNKNLFNEARTYTPISIVIYYYADGYFKLITLLNSLDFINLYLIKKINTKFKVFYYIKDNLNHSQTASSSSLK